LFNQGWPSRATTEPATGEKAIMSPAKPTPQPPTEPAERLSRRATLAGLAVLPAALPVAAAAAADPIFTAIERHRELSDRASVTSAVSAKLMDGPEFEAADAITAAQHDDLREYAETLVRTGPTTIPGAIAVMRYVAGLRVWQLPEGNRELRGTGGDQPDDWSEVFLNTLADALGKIGATK